MRVLVTGGGGFAAGHFVTALSALHPAANMLITAKKVLQRTPMGAVESLNITNRAAVDEVIAQFVPTHVINLASFSSPSLANAHPQLVWDVNYQGVVNLAESIIQRVPDCRLIQVGSGLVYAGLAGTAPLAETAPLSPIDVYSITKAAADSVLEDLGKTGLRCVRFRPFNHTGPGQSEHFVIPSFCMQIAQIEAGLVPPVLHVGNLAARRDFLDVRDVTKAYALALADARIDLDGEVFNVSSGIALTIEGLLERLLAQTKAPIEIQRDPDRQRRSDVECLIGDSRRAQQGLNWRPQISIDEMLKGVLAHARSHVRPAHP